MAKLIAICGKQLSGKTTTKGVLRAELERAGYEVVERSFAGPLKRVVADVLGVTVDDVNAIKTGRDGEAQADKMRRLLQQLGTDCFRNYADDVWLRAFERSIDMGRTNAVYIVDDARFPNEVELIKSLGGYVARLDISPAKQALHGIVKNPKHASETALDDFDGFDTRCDSDNMTPAEMAASILADFLIAEAIA